MNLILPKPWHLKESALTSERDYLNRREFLKKTGLALAGVSGLMAGLGASGCSSAGAQGDDPKNHPAIAYVSDGLEGLFPAKRNEKYKLDRDMTGEVIAGTYNNFYEFDSQDKSNVWPLAKNFTQRPWSVQIKGLCERAGQTVDLDDIARIAPMEERTYRFRCVEAWAMAVPWTGYPLAKFIQWCQPRPEARYIRFVTFLRPKEAPGQVNYHWYKWPYYEALRMDEAMNELALLTFGIYGHPMPMQHGAPLRVIAPWKYGYKSPKSIVEVEFVSGKPGTFWNDKEPTEYSFLSNVNPKVPHPRWSQATERLIGEDRRVPTQIFNGYAEQVRNLYPEEPV
jgi:sulfoxide reductase catalytic subunit YedY